MRTIRNFIFKTDFLLEHATAEGSETLENYQKVGGYEALKKALKMDDQAIRDEVKESGLRGRGGAGFPTGVKWGFVPLDLDKPKYLIINADESEPGTYKDRVIMELVPHMLVEGSIISARAIRSNVVYIYIRGEYFFQEESLQKAIDEAYEAGLLGKNILGSGYDCDMYIHKGAGAYICGEETALIESLEGKRGFPRLKPPFPAVVGAFGCPTIVNNVETIANVPHIINRGADWYKSIGTEKSTGTRLFGVSGHVNRPGIYELPLGYPLTDLLEKDCGGIRNGNALKAVIPGGSSVPILTAEEVNAGVNLDFESCAAAGTMLGSAGVIVLDETTCIVETAENVAHFYAHESCGQCTPCREGCWWMQGILHRIHEGKGKIEDLDLLQDICDNMMFRTICPLGDAAAMPIGSYIQKFREEFEYNILKGESPVKKDPSIKVPQHV
jgi:NADH-quinone oxidoreductase subunit F